MRITSLSLLPWPSLVWADKGLDTTGVLHFVSFTTSQHLNKQLNRFLKNMFHRILPDLIMPQHSKLSFHHKTANPGSFMATFQSDHKTANPSSSMATFRSCNQSEYRSAK